ncbi:MAG TPA: hypothetical protein VII06_25745 [Chloroflexota bacterium]
MRVTKASQLQGIIRLYRDQTGQSEVDMHDVARFARQRGWPMPRPIDPLERLASEFSKAAREELRRDSKTGRPYRANHAFPIKQGATQLYLWVDIDEAPRGPMQKSLVNRREQIVGDVLQLTFDAEHWNNIHPDETPIVMPTDFTDDVEWRMNGEDEQPA